MEVSAHPPKPTQCSRQPQRQFIIARHRMIALESPFQRDSQIIMFLLQPPQPLRLIGSLQCLVGSLGQRKKEGAVTLLRRYMRLGIGCQVRGAVLADQIM